MNLSKKFLSIIFAISTSLAASNSNADIVVMGWRGGPINNHMEGYSDMSFLWAVPVFDISMLNLGDYSSYLAEPEIVVEGARQPDQQQEGPVANAGYLGFDGTIPSSSRDWAEPEGGCQFDLCLSSELEVGIVDDSEEAKADQRKVDEATALLEQATAGLTPAQKEEIRPLLETAANEAKIQETLTDIGDEPDYSKFSATMQEVTIRVLDIGLQNDPSLIIPDPGTVVNGQVLYDYYFGF